MYVYFTCYGFLYNNSFLTNLEHNHTLSFFLKKGDKRPYPLITFSCEAYSAAGASTSSSPCFDSRIASAILAVKSLTARIASSFAGIT
mgnify:FL=1